jgi:hypothetical protein
MASPFQQQARRRKLIYFGVILVLFTGAYLWRTNVVASQARQLALREVDRGDVELTGSLVRLLLTGSRGLATCVLWNSAIDKQKKNQWNELEILVRSVTKLQPHFITPWLFQSWNLSYNVSVGADRVNDKYFYITRGIQLLAEGERQNRDNPDLRYWIGFYNQHKICKSDETNVQRSLFQLSLIPPNERDPARFKQINPETGKEEINYVELEDFCKKHPQLVRRLREGMMRETMGESKRQFTCPTSGDVVRFLADNYRVPSPFEERSPASVGQWQKRDDDKLKAALTDRYPPLPPKRNPAPPQHLFSNNEYNADDVGQLGDDVDAYIVARSWFAYAQEPIPDPGDLPGSTKPIEDRTRQRKPRQITTLIFRNHPALAQANNAERLQQEGWFDNELWPIKGWFPKDQFTPKEQGSDRKPEAKIGDERRKWSQEAWADARDRWQRHGEENHLVFASEEKKANMEQLAADFAKKYDVHLESPPTLRTENMDEHDKECYFAIHFMRENKFYRGVSNFDTHLIRARVDATDEAIEGRKAFYQAERLRWEGSVDRSLAKYSTALPYWRDKVLLKNKDFRRFAFVMEDSFDWQYRYMRLYHEQYGKRDKQRLVDLARVMPLVPKADPSLFTGWILKGALDVLDEEGYQLVDDDSRRHVLARKPAPPGSRHGTREAPPSSSKPN